MSKPFYKIPIYPIERSKYNPLRYIIGKTYLSNDVVKWAKQREVRLSKINIKY